jgi:hypothetical protein
VLGFQFPDFHQMSVLLACAFLLLWDVQLSHSNLLQQVTNFRLVYSYSPISTDQQAAVPEQFRFLLFIKTQVTTPIVSKELPQQHACNPAEIQVQAGASGSSAPP